MSVEESESERVDTSSDEQSLRDEIAALKRRVARLEGARDETQSQLKELVIQRRKLAQRGLFFRLALLVLLILAYLYVMQQRSMLG